MSSSSLLRPLENIHISSQPVEYKDPNSQIELQVPNWDTPRRVLYYGFNFTEEWLLNYSATHWNEYTPHLDIKKYRETTRGTCGFYMLREASGFPYLELKCAAPNARAIAENTWVANTAPERIVPVLSLCSSLRRSYNNRPTQAQFDRLVEIVGKEPEWWVQHRTGDLN